MCGIAGALDLRGKRAFSAECILAMTGAIAHRGPDDEQVHLEPGLALGVRRLAIIDVKGGRQPIPNERRDVWVAWEGELYDYPQLRPQLLSRGHILRTHCDTEAWVHLYEDHGPDVFRRAKGQFTTSLWDGRTRTLFLARDRAGISPLFYTIRDGWLLWSSEIKGLLASGMVEGRPDPRGIDYFFNFFVLSNTRTCFKGVHSLPPGHYLEVRDGNVERRQYWDLDFPERGCERPFRSPEDALDEYEQLMRGAVRRRLIAERPICCYISGGLDSTTMLGLAAQENGSPLHAFTIALDGSGPTNERSQAQESAALIGSPLTAVDMRAADIAAMYPNLIQGAEGPVLDTSAACTTRLAEAVRDNGFIISLSGEGADESLAGYIWFKAHKYAMAAGRTVNDLARKLLLTRLGGGSHRPPFGAVGGIRVAQQFSFEIMAQSREWLYSPQMWRELDGYSPYDELEFDVDRMKRWHPLNQSLYAANKIMLPGMLLAAKGDRALRHASLEGRFPFLDERIVEFCAQLPANYKLRGLTDKWLLRQLARRVLPAQIANRPKTMFRANLSSTFLGPDAPEWARQLLSPESLQATGIFSSQGVEKATRTMRALPRRSLRRFVLDMGLTGVVSTQLWCHLFCGGGLADLPVWSPQRQHQTLPESVLALPSRTAV